MGAVSIASVENLSDLVASLAACREGAEESFREEACELARLIEEADANQHEANQALEDARQYVARCRMEISRIESDMDNSDPPDNPGPSQRELEEAQDELADAKAHEFACQVRLEEAVALFAQAQAKQDAFLANGRLSLSRIDDLAAQCTARANRACEALENYLATNPNSAVATFCAWARWAPPAGSIINPSIILSRLQFPDSQLKQALTYLIERQPDFKSKVENYRMRYHSTMDDIGKDAVLTQVKRNLSGEFVERIVQLAFNPIGEVSTQARTYFEDGSYTKTDLIVENLKVPVILGKGDRAYAPEGGTLAIEIKAGHASYLKAQKDHLVFQAGGHQNADASATICTGDIQDLSEEDQQALRDALKNAGSPIKGMLPKKDDIDQALFDLLSNNEKADG